MTFIRSIIAVLVFLGGVVNLVSVATPAVPARIKTLLEFVTFRFIELTHIITLIIGLALL